MMRKPKIIITSTIENAHQIKKEVEDLNFTTQINPVLFIKQSKKNIPDKLLDKNIIITSINAANILTNLTSRKNLNIITLSKALKNKLLALGFKKIIHPNTKQTDNISLTKFLDESFGKRTDFIHFCGNVTAGKINPKKHKIENFALYESILNKDFSAEFLKQEKDTVVCFFSPLAAKFFINFVQKKQMANLCKNKQAYCLSNNIKKELLKESWQDIKTSKYPNLEFFLNLFK